MANPTATVEVKLSEELKELCDRLPENMSERLAQVEKSLANIEKKLDEYITSDQTKRERVLRNVSGPGKGKYVDPSRIVE